MGGFGRGGYYLLGIGEFRGWTWGGWGFLMGFNNFRNLIG